jgi:hypothetical protein
VREGGGWDAEVRRFNYLRRSGGTIVFQMDSAMAVSKVVEAVGTVRGSFASGESWQFSVGLPSMAQVGVALKLLTFEN